ncbi:MAG: NAD(P)H-hydrate epimerase [Planctomycetota bacterium]|jgi:NAD(P)H-hydrate epimerase|nr:NAD(P)H-hydrate epimerase [Planctomycetota bacterium]
MPSPRVLTCAQSRELDARAEELDIPGLALMENAGAGAARVILALLERGAAQAPVGLLCGGGNNGGDAYVVARHLHGAGVEVQVWKWTEVSNLPRDAARNARCLARTAVPRHPLPRLGATSAAGSSAALADLEAAFGTCGLLVDGLLGTGFTGTLRPDMAAILEAARRSARPILALDLPSGLNGDSGLASPGTLRARWTVTFAALKPALVGDSTHGGEVFCVPLGLPPEAFSGLGGPLGDIPDGPG